MHVDVNFGRPSKKTPLYNAVKKDHPEIVEMLLNVPGIDLVTGNPLLVAVQRGHLSIVKMLVNVPGIDVNAGDPLQEALQRGNLEIVELLVQAQGLDDTTPGFQQAMQYAKDHPYTGVADAILQAPTLSRGTFRKKSVSRLLCCGDVDRV